MCLPFVIMPAPLPLGWKTGNGGVLIVAKHAMEKGKKEAK